MVRRVKQRECHSGFHQRGLLPSREQGPCAQRTACGEMEPTAGRSPRAQKRGREARADWQPRVRLGEPSWRRWRRRSSLSQSKEDQMAVPQQRKTRGWTHKRCGAGRPGGGGSAQRQDWARAGVSTPTSGQVESGDSHDSYQATGGVRERPGTLIYTHPLTSKVSLGKLRERGGGWTESSSRSET